MSSDQDEEIVSWEDSGLKEEKEDDQDIEADNEIMFWNDVDSGKDKTESGDEGASEKNMQLGDTSPIPNKGKEKELVVAPDLEADEAFSWRDIDPGGAGNVDQNNGTKRAESPATIVSTNRTKAATAANASGTFPVSSSTTAAQPGNPPPYVPTAGSTSYAGAGFHVMNSSWVRRGQTTANPIYNPDGKYPHDNYSFIALNGPTTSGSWPLIKFLFFLFGLVPFIFQMLFLVMLVWSETDELRGTIGENDNPDSEKDGILGNLASFIPANANRIIRWTQVTAIIGKLVT